MARSMQRNIPERMEGRPAPRRRRLLRRRHDPHQTDRRARSAWCAPAGPGPRRRWLGALRRKPARWTSSVPNSSARSSRARWSSSPKGRRKPLPLPAVQARFCIFEHVYFSRPDSASSAAARSMRPADSIGRRAGQGSPGRGRSGLPGPGQRHPGGHRLTRWNRAFPMRMGIIRNQYMGRTFIEPSEQIRNMGVRLKLNVNRALIAGKRVMLVDDSVVRGTTSRKIKDMILDAGAAEVHFRIASPPTAWPCFYGVDTPAARKAAGGDHDRGRNARSGSASTASTSSRWTVFTARSAKRRGAMPNARNIAMPVSRGITPSPPSTRWNAASR